MHASRIHLGYPYIHSRLLFRHGQKAWLKTSTSCILLPLLSHSLRILPLPLAVARSQLTALRLLNHPRMIQHLLDSSSRAHVPIQHLPYKIDARLAHHIWDPQIAIHDLIDTVEWVFLVDDSVKEDTEGPDILLFAVVGFAG